MKDKIVVAVRPCNKEKDTEMGGRCSGTIEVREQHPDGSTGNSMKYTATCSVCKRWWDLQSLTNYTLV